MTVQFQDSTKFLEEIGFKRAIPTDFWVHPNKNKVFYSKRLTKYSWDFRPVKVNKPTNSGGKVLYQYEYLDGKLPYPLHKVKALAFCDLSRFKSILGDDFKYEDLKKHKICVNHLDGDKFNNDADNLEWCTASENNTHALKEGLRKDNFFGVCYDALEDKEIPFYSINSLGKEIGIHPGYISSFLKSKRESLLGHRYNIRKADEETYPHNLTIEDAWKPGIFSISPVRVYNTLTGETTDFPTYKLASDYIKVARIKKKGFGGKFRTIRSKHYELTPINDYYRIMELKEAHDKIKYESLNTNRAVRKPLEVIVELENGMTLYYTSLEEAANVFGTTKIALKARINKYNGMWKGKKFSYVK